MKNGKKTKQKEREMIRNIYYSEGILPILEMSLKQEWKINRHNFFIKRENLTFVLSTQTEIFQLGHFIIE